MKRFCPLVVSFSFFPEKYTPPPLYPERCLNARNGGRVYIISPWSQDDPSHYWTRPHQEVVPEIKGNLKKVLWSQYPRQQEESEHMIPYIVDCFRGGTEGGAILLHFWVLPTLFSCSKMSPFYLKTCTPVKGTPWSTLWLQVKMQMFAKALEAFEVSIQGDRPIQTLERLQRYLGPLSGSISKFCLAWTSSCDCRSFKGQHD